MNYTVKPSLEHIALVKVTATLWGQNDIRELTAQFSTPLDTEKISKEWLKIEIKVNEKVSQIPIPGSLKEKLLNFIKPIGVQILRWIEYYRDNPYIGIALPANLCWTPQGTVNDKKTAEILITDETIDIASRYKLACVCCLEEDIPKLWGKMSEDCRKFFCSEEDQQELVVLWTHHTKGDIDKVQNIIEKKLNHGCSFYQYAFEKAASDGNKVATEYFMQKLCYNKKKECILKSAKSAAYGHLKQHSILLRQYNSDILCLLLSQMDEEQQTELFKDFSCQVLMCLLDWPWHIFFSETASRMWNFLPEMVYNCLLHSIADKVNRGYKYLNYEKLIEENWKQSSDGHKRQVFASVFYRGSQFLTCIFKNRDENNIRLIFKDATLLEKKKIMYSVVGQDICQDLIEGEEWGLLEYFFRECVTSKIEMMKLKKDIEAFIVGDWPKDEHEKRKDKSLKLHSLLNDLIDEFDKRKCIEEDIIIYRNPKRLCCI